MKTILLSIVSMGIVPAVLSAAVLCISAMDAFAAPTLTDCSWTSKDGELSGAFDDPDHWSPAGVPGALTLAKIDVSTDATVTLPAGEFDTLASLRLNATSPGVLTWDGSQTVFRQVTSATANYGNEPFGFRRHGSHFFNLQTYSTSAATIDKTAISTIANGKFRLAALSSGGARIDFDSGSYNFYDADGVTACSDRVMMVNRNNIGGSMVCNFHPGTSTRFPIFKILDNFSGTGNTSSFNFLGGSHEIFGNLEMPTAEAYSAYKTVTSLLITNGAALAVHGSTIIGAKAHSTYAGGGDYAMGKQYRFRVADGGALTFNGSFKHATAGRLEIDVDDGGTLAFAGESALVGGQMSTGVVTVARGGAISGTLALGAADGRAEMVVDGGAADFTTLDVGAAGDGEAVLVVTNGARMSTGAFNLCKGEVSLPDGIAWTNTGMARIGYNAGALAGMAVNSGATFRVMGQLDVGSANGEGRLDILGGTVWQRNPDSNTSYMYIANGDGSTGTVNLAAGELKAMRLICGNRGPAVLNVSGGSLSTEGALQVPYAQSGYADTAEGTMNVSGGSIKVGDWDYLSVGACAKGTVNVSGGQIDAMGIYLGQYVDNNAGTWATLRQTGGSIILHQTADRQDVGVKLADNDTRNTRLILDGGVMRAHHIFGNKSRAAGYSGYAAFAANGGTVEVPFAASALFANLDEAKLGPKGLTVRSDYACGIPQSFTDADGADGEGLLVLAGTGVKTLTPTNSTVGRLAVAGGTVLFAPNAAGVQAVQHSAVTVTNNAALSLVGAQTSLALRSLTLGDAETMGVLALDPGDVIRVEGDFAVNLGRIVLSEDFSIGSEYGLMELDGDRADELSGALSRLMAIPGPGQQKFGYSFAASYDADAGKTRIAMRLFEAPASGTTAWRGPGAAWADGANWSDGRPDASDIAVFDSGTAPAAVSVADVQPAGGLVFDADVGYVISGGTLALQTVDGGRIDVTQGVHAVESMLMLPDGMPVYAASGAGLTLGGRVLGGDLVKDGPGRLAFTNDVNVLGNVTVTGGTLAVSSPGALCVAANVTMKTGAIELGGAAGEETVYGQPITLSNPVPTNAVTLRVSHDVTLPSLTVSQGLPYKDGPGRLTLTTSTGTAKVIAVGDGTTADWCPGYRGNTGVVEYGPDGIVDDGVVLAGFTVAEGELALRGTVDGAQFNAVHYFTVGVPGVTAAASPALTLDHVRLHNDASARHMLIGPGLTAGNSNVTDVHVTVTNGATLACNTLYVARNASKPGVTHHVLADASTISSSWRTHANCNSGAGSTSEFVFRNGASFLVGGSFNMPYRSTLDFDASIFAKNANFDLTSLTYMKDYNPGNYTRSGADFTFRNGSRLYLASGDILANSSQAQPTTLTFDDSEWIAAKDADCTFVYETPGKVAIRTAGGGLILTVPAGRTWTMAQAVTGTGGLVKRGDGTLAFDTHKCVSAGATNDYASATTTLDFTGTARVEKGTLVVRPGAAAAGVKFEVAADAAIDLGGGTVELGAISGEGTVRNGTVTGAIPVTLDVGESWTVRESLPVFDTDSVGFGSVYVDLGRTAENPVAKPFETVVVGRYSGAAPSLAGWRVRGVGMDGVKGSFAASDGEIRMTLRQKGMFFSFR